MDDLDKIHLIQYLMSEYDRLSYDLKIKRHLLICNKNPNSDIILDYYIAVKRLEYFEKLNHDICSLLAIY